MAVVSQHLFELIRSLSASEKRYFKIHLGRSEGSKKNNYEALFDAMNRYPHDVYEEDVFRKLNRGKPFLKNLATEKQYLYRQLLKIVKNFTAESNPYLRFYAQINEILFLLTHGLTHQAEEMCVMLIEQYPKEDFLKQILLRQMLKNAYAHRDDTLTPKIVKLTETEVLPLIKGYEFRLRVTSLQRKYVYYESRGYLKAHESELAELLGQFRSLAAQKDIDSFSEITIATNIVAMLGFMEQHDESAALALQFLKKFDNERYNPFYGNRVKAVLLINTIESMLEGKYIEEAPAMIDELEKTIHFEGYSDPASLSVHSMLLRLRHLLFTGNIEDGLQLLSSIDEEMKQCVPPPKPFTWMAMLAYESEFLVQAGKYTELIERINSNPYIGQRDPVLQYSQFVIQLSEFVCHLYLRNYSLMQSLVLSMKRKLVKREINGDYHTALISVFESISKSNVDDSIERAALQKMLEEQVPANMNRRKLFKQAVLKALLTA